MQDKSKRPRRVARFHQHGHVFRVFGSRARKRSVERDHCDHDQDLRSNTENKETSNSLIPLSLRTLDSTIYFKGRTLVPKDY